MKRKGFLYAVISACSYGLIPLFIIPVKIAGFTLDKTLFYRFFLAFLCVLAYFLYKKKDLKLSAFETLIMMILGLFYALSSEFLFIGYDLLSPGIASTLLFIYPIIVAFIMAVFYKEALKPATYIALAITSIGVCVISMKDSMFSINLFGLFIAFLSALFYSLYIVIVNKAKLESSGLKVTLFSLLFSSVYYLIKLIILGDTLAVDMAFLLNTTVFSLVTTVLSMVTLVYAIKLIGSTPTSIMGALEPVVATCISVLVFHEHLTLMVSVGMLLIVVGVSINVLFGTKTKH